MKITIATLLAAIALPLTAAAQDLRVEMTIATDGNRVVSRPTLIIQNGKHGSITSGDKESKFSLALTPTLKDNRTVDIQALVSYRKGKKTDRLLVPHRVVQLGKVARFQADELSLTTKVTLHTHPGSRGKGLSLRRTDRAQKL